MEDAFYILYKLVHQMDISFEGSIEIGFFQEREPIEYSDGLVSVVAEDTVADSGRYIQYDNGDIEIAIEEKQLGNPIALIATLAHELAHFKLLGEKRIAVNDEILTELVVLIYGIGVFNANSSIAKMHTLSNNVSSGWKIMGVGGYLDSKLHGFALALYASYRKEINPSWVSFLEPDILREFKKSSKYINDNPEEVRFTNK